MSRRAPSIDEVILRLYEKAKVPQPSGETPITPLRDIVNGLNLNCVELPNLTSRAAADFLMLRGISIITSENLNDIALAGYLHVTMNFGCIFVNQNDRLTRRRFSIAHELGHYTLHLQPALDKLKRQGQSLSVSIIDLISADDLSGAADVEDPLRSNSSAQVSFSDNEKAVGLLPSMQEMEMEADLFASEILMPRDVICAIASKFELSKEDLAWRLANDMLVSRSSMYRRLDELHYC